MGIDYEKKCIGILPPYVAEENKQMLDDAESSLKNYSETLARKLKKELYRHGSNIKPKTEDICAAERAFYDDPVRLSLVGHLGLVKSIVEVPRFTIPDGKSLVDLKQDPLETEKINS